MPPEGHFNREAVALNIEKQHKAALTGVLESMSMQLRYIAFQQDPFRDCVSKLKPVVKDSLVHFPALLARYRGLLYLADSVKRNLPINAAQLGLLTPVTDESSSQVYHRRAFFSRLVDRFSSFSQVYDENGFPRVYIDEQYHRRVHGLPPFGPGQHTAYSDQRHGNRFPYSSPMSIGELLEVNEDAFQHYLSNLRTASPGVMTRNSFVTQPLAGDWHPPSNVASNASVPKWGVDRASHQPYNQFPAHGSASPYQPMPQLGDVGDAYQPSVHQQHQANFTRPASQSVRPPSPRSALPSEHQQPAGPSTSQASTAGQGDGGSVSFEPDNSPFDDTVREQQGSRIIHRRKVRKARIMAAKKAARAQNDAAPESGGSDSSWETISPPASMDGGRILLPIAEDGE